jgi:hypothetical protein
MRRAGRRAASTGPRKRGWAPRIQHAVRTRKILATLALIALGPAAQAQDHRFAGTWRIRRLIGQTIAFGPKTVAGPKPLGCWKPVYATRQDGPDMLFQGSLAEPDRAGKPRDAATLARGLGMTSATIATLEVGCSEVEFHALAPDVLVFGLDNRVYTVRRIAGKGAQ